MENKGEKSKRKKKKLFQKEKKGRRSEEKGSGASTTPHVKKARREIGATQELARFLNWEKGRKEENYPTKS